MSDSLNFRTEVRPTDREAVRGIVASSGFFSGAEIAVAVELVDDRLTRGAASDYHFVFVEDGGQVLGYTCFGLIPCTQASFDLYWVAVHADYRGRGLGRELIQRTEQAIARGGGLRVYIETSSRPQYEPTKAFYLSSGYREAAHLPDFYAPGDGKLIYEKQIATDP